MLPTGYTPRPTPRSCHEGPRWVGLCVLLGATAFAQAPPTKSINELKAFYQQNCVRCHGTDGSAQDLDGNRLGGLDFTKAAKAFRTVEGPVADRQIRTMIRVIQKGLMFGFSMPAWKAQLSQEETALMVKEVLLKAEPGKAIKPEAELAKAN